MPLALLPLTLLLLLLVSRGGGSPTKQCPPHSREAVSRAGVYCLCDRGAACRGRFCKTGQVGGAGVSGFPALCSACTCTVPSGTALEPAARPDPPTRALPPPPPRRTEAVPAVARRDPADEPTLPATAATAAAPAHRLKVVYIKSYKVGSTTMAAVFQRLSDERQLKVATRFNSVSMLSDAEFDIVLSHNYYGNKNWGGEPCFVMPHPPRGWSWCGGYQPWMDEYVTGAEHLVLVADPLPRMASMMYYERGWTKLKDRLPGDAEYSRMSANDQAQFEDPQGADLEAIQKWLAPGKYGAKWDRVQWHWLRESTANRTLDDTIALLQTRFMVGLTSRFDETLLIWRRRLGLNVRDIVYTSVKAQLSHPKVTDWTPKCQSLASSIIDSTGDARYYQAAVQRFEEHVAEYGAEQLEADTAKFRLLLSRLSLACKDHFLTTETLHVPDKVFCMLRRYDAEYERQVEVVRSLGCFSSPTPAAGYEARYAQKLHSREMSLSRCTAECTRHGLTHIAVTMQFNCFCGSADPMASNKLDDAECSSRCNGFPCGHPTHFRRFSVYAIVPRGAGYQDPIITIAEQTSAGAPGS